MTLVIEVPTPWATFQPGQHPPLQPGMFCEVTINAKTVPEAVLIPRAALHDHDTVYLAQDRVLRQRRVTVLRLLRDQAIVTSGLQQGEQVVISPLDAPVIGMTLRPIEVDPPLLAPMPTADRTAPAAVVVQQPADQEGTR